MAEMEVEYEESDDEIIGSNAYRSQQICHQDDGTDCVDNACAVETQTLSQDYLSQWEETYVNTSGSCTNCYYTSLAGLLGKTVAELEKITGIKEKNCAYRSEIVDLYQHKEIGYIGAFKEFYSRDDVKRYIAMDVPDNPALGIKRALIFHPRGENAQHMVVFKAGRNANDRNKIQYRIIDFQLNGINRIMSLPDNCHSYSVYSTSYTYLRDPRRFCDI